MLCISALGALIGNGPQCQVPRCRTNESRRGQTAGGSLELVNEFEIMGGGAVDPHTHPTHEFYYVLYGKGKMIIGQEIQEVSQGDLVYIPPNEVHSLEAISENAPIRCFCFAVACPDAGDINYTTH